MTSIKQDLDPKVVIWAADIITTCCFPTYNTFRLQERREHIRRTLQSGGLSCLSKKELRTLYDGLLDFANTTGTSTNTTNTPRTAIRTHLPRKALKGEIVGALTTFLRDPNVIQKIPSVCSTANTVAASTMLTTGTSTSTLTSQLPVKVQLPVPLYPSAVLPSKSPSQLPSLTSNNRKRPRPSSFLMPMSAEEDQSFHAMMQAPMMLPLHSPYTMPQQLRLDTHTSLPPLPTSWFHNTPDPEGQLTPTQTLPPTLPPPSEPPRQESEQQSHSKRPTTSVTQPSITATSPPVSRTSTEATDTHSSSTDIDTDLSWIQQLHQCGFTDDHELRTIIMQAKQKEDTLSLESLICDIIAAREEHALARDMDEARRQSELEHQQEQERLKTQRTQEIEQQLLDATFDELLHPPPQCSKFFFPRSWLLRHPPLERLVQDVCLNHIDTKKEFIQLLKLEKDSFRWYSNGIAKSFFTHHLNHRLSNLDPKALNTELQEICQELKEAHALRSKQNQSGIPLIYIQAQQEHPTLEITTAQEGDDDVQVLDDEQIQKLKMESPCLAPPIELDMDGWKS